MPLPTPRADETEGEFVGRCMSEVQGEFESQDQRLAVCYGQWRDRGKAMSLKSVTRETLIEAAKAGRPTDGLVVRKALVPDTVEPVEGGRVVRFVISTGAVDRDNDTINPKGWDLAAYKRNPVVLWAHDYTALPIGRATTVEMADGKLVSECEFAEHAFAETVYQLVKGGFLRATSVGFQPKTFKVNAERDGLDFAEQELMEYSIVPVPANPEALIDLPTAKAAGIDVEPLRAWAEGVLKGLGPKGHMPKQVVVPRGPGLVASLTNELDEEDDPVRWNRSLSKAFDVDGEPAEPSSQFYKWVGRYLECPVKDLYETGMMAGGPRMGAQLSAVDDVTGERFMVASVRNLRGSTEAPPVYETIRLNSRLSRSFLIEGTKFLVPKGDVGRKLVVRATETWGGVWLTFYAHRESQPALVDLLASVGAKASTYQFLKGEAFSLSGEFLTRGTETWDDLFLDAKVLEPIRRTAQLVNERGREMESRGQILMGPPGTGKTLAGRVLMNDAKDATFIWLSSRDLYRSGMYGGLTSAYDLAAENAPAVVFIEDIDSWWDASTTDLLKTELDGLKQKSGILTVLTTNHPDQLPEALIDRPGRFHDVLNLALPDEAVRRRMLDKWAPDASVATRAQLAKQTAGLSGAHLRELVRFAQTIREQDDVDVDRALERALAKVQEQREVIGQLRVQRRSVKAITKAAGVLAGPVAKADGDGPDSCPPEADGSCRPGYELRDGACHRVEKKDAVPELLLPGETVVSAAQLAQAVADLLLPQLRATPGPAAEPQACCGCAQTATMKCAHDSCDHQMCAACATGAVGKAGGMQCPHHATKTAAAEAVAEPEVLHLDDDPREEVVLELSDEDDHDEIELSPEEFRDALRPAVAAAIGTLVREETQAALDRARGRVD